MKDLCNLYEIIQLMQALRIIYEIKAKDILFFKE